jgi:cysteine desulfurase
LTAFKPIYLDYNATTPVDEKVLQEMLPYFSQKFGNASSKTHAFGWLAADAVDLARERVAKLINAEKEEIIFTSGATESINLALKGVAAVYKQKGNHIVTVATEHKAVLDCCNSLEKNGFNITYLPVNNEGIVDIETLRNAITSSTILIAVMLANNETGVIQPIKKIADIAHEHNIIFISDATQAIGKMPVNVQDLAIDIMPLSAHKFYGPKGVGALFIRRKKPRVVLTPLIEGGGHEKNLRSGTLNVPGIAGMGKAAEMALSEINIYTEKIITLRNKLEAELLKIEGAKRNGSNSRLPNTSNITFSGINSNELIKQFAAKLAVATGSACTSALPQPSHVLKAMGISDAEAYASIRFSLGKYTIAEEIDAAIKIVKEAISTLK